MDLIFSVKQNIETINIKYSLFLDSDGEREFYSIEISEDFGDQESLLLEDIADSFESAHRLFLLLSENTVTVCTAKNVLEDILPV